ncbi:hypothetical protein DMN91_000879 [Ooceraea biroi]|uniref:Ionotropic glutamate receptor C-terminal domain-containing protein n=2 Tax=Ooceraea biroi TaxID=2015173 RepID=A0A3L8E2W5_OOCBI|nr:hypothetical protein DMN91_000879 [Ooceraea biroi]
MFFQIVPYVIVNASTNEVTGFMGDVWKTLEEILEFKTIYKKVKWTPFWTLLETNFDELLIATSMYVYSSSYLTYSVPFTTVWYALFIQPDGAIITTWWYINIFSDGAWTVSFVFGMCIACSIIGVQRVKKLTCINKKHFDDEFSSPFFNILYVLGGMTGQVPRDLSMRIIALALLMMGMLLSYGFSSTLTSCLTSKGNSVAITNLEDVETKRSHSLCMRNNSGAYGYFTVNETKDSELKDKWKELVNKDCPDMSNKEVLISQMCRPGFVYLEVPGVFLPTYKLVEHTCELLQLQTTYWKRKLSFVHTKTASHRQLIDAYLMRMRSAGILTYLEKKWILDEFNTPARHVQSNTFQAVEFVHIRLTICALFIMMFVSSFICILENVWYKQQEKSQRKNSTLILLGVRDSKPNLTKAYQARSRLRWRRKFNSILLLDTNNSEFFQNVTVRINRWQMSRSRL